MISVVDSHHKALMSWANFRKKLNTAPRLISLDHHTDTSPPFRHYIRTHQKTENFLSAQSKHLESIDFTNSKTVASAIEKLRNDEHIVTAIKTNIISSAFILAHNADDTDIDIYKEHKIVCRNISDHDTVLESSTLAKAFQDFNSTLKEADRSQLFTKPYILDIDLDYFNTFKSIDPEDSNYFKKLIQHAGLISIATEPEYVKSCALEPGLTSEFLMKHLRSNFLSLRPHV